MGGAFLTSREIFENDIWNDVVKFRIFFYIVGNAVFSQDGIEIAGIKVQRGQFLRSLRNLQEDLAYREGRGNSIKKYPLETIRRKIKSLENEERITTKSTEYGTLFTVVNYHIYQDFSHYQNGSMGQRWDSNETAMGQRWDNNNKDNKDNKSNKKNTRQKQVYDEESIPFKLAKYLNESIKKNLPEHKEPNFQAWADDMRKIIELDNRDPKQVAKVIKWVQNDSFWWKNILSPSKLRVQYESLLANIRTNNKSKDVPAKSQRKDIRDKEIEFQRWVSEGNDPNEFDWSK